MANIITDGVFDMYSRFSPRSDLDNKTPVSITILKRYSQDQKFKRRLSREADIKIRDKQLFHIKEDIPEVHATVGRPFMGLCCQNCTFTSHTSLVKRTTEKLALLNLLKHQNLQAKTGFFSKTFPHLYQLSKLKKYLYPQVAHLVLKDETVKQAIEKAAVYQLDNSDSKKNKLYQELLKRSQRRAERILLHMESAISDFSLKFTSWILYKLLPYFFRSVVVHPGQLEMLKESSKLNLPIIFLPLHRSELDPVLLSFILLNNNIQSPLVAVGDNLKFPFFGLLLRGLGAFFLKSHVNTIMGHEDYIYKSILHTYINLCLRAGHNIALFLEEECTQTGKPCLPKNNLLSAIMETFMDGTIEDALLVPVSVNYEKLIDGNFIEEQLGKHKEKETFMTSVKAIWHVLKNDFGTVRVDFNQPFSLRELIMTGELNKKEPNKFNVALRSSLSSNSLHDATTVSEQQTSLVEIISKHVFFDCIQFTAIMSTNAITFLLLTKFRNGVSLGKLVTALDDLRQELEFARKDVGFSGNPEDVINYAVDLLGIDLVQREKSNGEIILRPMSMLPNVIELSYYSNSVIAHYALESVIALALSVSEVKLDTLSHDDIMKNALELCDVFQFEFLFCKPCQSLEHIITSSLDDLVVRKEIFLPEENSEIVHKSRKLASQFDDEEQELVQKLYKLNTAHQASENIRCLRNILQPLIETYAIAAFMLDKLVQRQLLESELIDEVFNEMKHQLQRGCLKFGESVSVDSIKNALKLFQKWGVLECHSENMLQLYYLKESYDDTKSIHNIYNKINKYRIVT